MSECRIPLTRGFSTVVDASDFEWLNQFKWRYQTWGYATRSAHVEGRRRFFFMHRVILDAPKGLEVDHINGDKLDNRRDNLRLVTRSQNQQNILKARSDSTTGVRGVRKNGSCKSRPYLVEIWVDGKPHKFGTFADLEEATQVAQEARRLLMSHSPERRGVLVR